MKQKKTYPERQRTIGALLRTPYQHLAQEVYEQLAHKGYPEIRQSHSTVFRYILPKGSRITEMAELAGMTKQSMASLVDHLQKHGYVQIQPDPEDGRAKQVILTDRGKAVQKEAMRLSKEVEKRWATILGKDEMAYLRQLLDTLYEHLSCQDES